MLTTVAYYIVLIAGFAYLTKYGGKTGFRGGALQLTASCLTLIIAMTLRGTSLLLPMLNLVDFILLVGLVTLACVSTRYWPIWVAAFQVNVVAAHVVVWIVPRWQGDLYYAMITVWAVPSLLVMIIGTALDHRSRT